MAQHGGSRNRSGPPPSSRSEKARVLSQLPAEGYSGPVPEFPLDGPTDRELEVWAQLWRTPQAAAWASAAESWRVRTVALYCRTSVRCEDPEVPASLLAQLHRFGDQIGLTTAGLIEMGYRVASDEVAQAAAKPKPKPTARRMRAVPDVV
jgi:hypothetical protein